MIYPGRQSTRERSLKISPLSEAAGFKKKKKEHPKCWCEVKEDEDGDKMEETNTTRQKG